MTNPLFSAFFLQKAVLFLSPIASLASGAVGERADPGGHPETTSFLGDLALQALHRFMVAEVVPELNGKGWTPSVLSVVVAYAKHAFKFKSLSNFELNIRCLWAFETVSVYHIDFIASQYLLYRYSEAWPHCLPLIHCVFSRNTPCILLEFCEQEDGHFAANRRDCAMPSSETSRFPFYC